MSCQDAAVHVHKIELELKLIRSRQVSPRERGDKITIPERTSTTVVLVLERGRPNLALTIEFLSIAIDASGYEIMAGARRGLSPGAR